MRLVCLCEVRVKSSHGPLVEVGKEITTHPPLFVAASDKCDTESECLSFAQSLRAVEGHWKEHLNSTGTEMDNPIDPTIVFTTESKNIVREYLNFSKSNETLTSIPFSFITNKHDVTPDSGALFQLNESVVADNAMLSSISTLQLQLATRISVVNCCSAFHRVIASFLLEGAGAASASKIHCLQEEQDPELRICCNRPSLDDPCWRYKMQKLNITMAGRHG